MTRAPQAVFACELHMHSTFSDGYCAPKELLRGAAEKGLSVIAMTDHDTAAGARAAIPLAAQLGIELIPAIEFTARHDGWPGDIDVLGYFVDLDDPAFCAREQAALDDIHARVAECCVLLTQAGYPVTMDEVFAQNPVYGGLRQVRNVAVARGYVEDELSAGTFVMPYWARIRLSVFTLAEQIAVIHAAGGVAILAHPGQIDLDGRWLGADDLAPLVAVGLDGVEVYHRAMDEAARAHFGALAEQFGLLVTGGSDEHGWSPDLPLMGQQPVTRAMVEALRSRGRR